MKIQTGKITSIEIEPEDHIIFRFNPRGLNLGPEKVEFTIGTKFINGSMSLVLNLPADNTYRSDSTFVLLDSPQMADVIEVAGMRLCKVSARQT